MVNIARSRHEIPPAEKMNVVGVNLLVGEAPSVYSLGGTAVYLSRNKMYRIFVPIVHRSHSVEREEWPG
jgi:hypothetical protein